MRGSVVLSIALTVAALGLVGWRMVRRASRLRGNADDPGFYDACKVHDDLLAPQGDFVPIVEAWDRYLELEPDDARAYLERGGSLHHLGRDDEARADVHRACTMGLPAACALEARIGPR